LFAKNLKISDYPITFGDKGLKLTVKRFVFIGDRNTILIFIAILVPIATIAHSKMLSKAAV